MRKCDPAKWEDIVDLEEVLFERFCDSAGAGVNVELDVDVFLVGIDGVVADKQLFRDLPSHHVDAAARRIGDDDAHRLCRPALRNRGRRRGSKDDQQDPDDSQHARIL